MPRLRVRDLSSRCMSRPIGRPFYLHESEWSHPRENGLRKLAAYSGCPSQPSGPALKRARLRADAPCMERFFGLALIIAAIYIGATVATEGLDHAFGGLFAGDVPIAVEAAAQADDLDGGAVAPIRRPVTERVRVEVQGDVDEYSARVGAD